MADGTVRGEFTLSSEQALHGLREIRDTGREADAALEQLGRRMDELGRKTVRPRVDLTGIAEANRQLTELELRLDRIGAKSVNARVGISGGFTSAAAQALGGGGGGGQGLVAGSAGSPLFGSLGGMAGRLPWWAMLAPVAPQLLGGAGGLAASAASAAGGLGVLGLGGGASLAAGAGLTMTIAKPAIAALGEITKAQDAYTKSVQEFGRQSSQAATAQRNLNQAITANPAAVGAGRQLTAFRQEFAQATAPARAAIYGGVSNVLFNARRATPTIAGAALGASTATANAASAFSGFLAQPEEQRMLLQLTGGFATNLPIAERSLENIATVFGHLAVDAIPFFTEANRWVEQWTSGLARQSADQPRVQAGMQHLVDSAKDWARLAGAAGRDIRDLFTAARPSGDSMVESLTTTLNKWDRWLQANPEKVRTFFREGEQGVSRIASILGNLTRDISQLFGYLSPILARAEQFLQFASGLGGGSLLAGGGLLYGAYEGARGALGGGGPSAGGALRAFIAGGGGGLPLVAGGGAISPGAAAVDRASLAGAGFNRASYLMAPSGFQTGGLGAGELALAAGGGVLLRGGATRDVLQARGEVAFNQAYGNLPGARFAPLEAGAVVPMAERGGLVGRIGQAGAGIRGAVGGAARIFLPLAGIETLATLGQGLAAGHGVLPSIQAAGARLGSFATGGAVSPQAMTPVGLPIAAALPAAGAVTAFGGLGTAATIATGGAAALPLTLAALLAMPSNTGASLSNPRTRQALQGIGTQAGNVRTPQDLQSFYRATAHIELAPELPPDQARKLKTAIQQATDVAAKNAGAQGANDFGSAFADALDRGKKPMDAVKVLMQGISGPRGELAQLGPRGAMAFSQGVADWAKSLAQANPVLQRPMRLMMEGIANQMNELNRTTGTTWEQLQNKIFFFNDQILQGSTTTWNKIGFSLTDPSTRSEAILHGVWGRIQQEAIDALKMMGFSQDQAHTIVTQTVSGKANQVAMAQSSVTQHQNITKAAGSAGVTALGTVARQRGGEIPGSGLLDTVNVGGAMAAPGEAYIANRHTMNDLSRATLEKFGKTAWEMIRDEQVPHSLEPPRSRRQAGGVGAPPILPAVTLGHSELKPGISAAVATVLGMFPALQVTSTLRPGESGSYHAIGEAADVSADAGTMFRAADWINSSGLARQLAEGIHNPNLSIKNGQPVSAGFWGPATWAQHLNHIHMAVAGALDAGALSGGAVGGGGAAGFMPTPITLKAPSTGIKGVPGLIADQSAKIRALGLQIAVNKATAATGGISGAGFSGGGSAGANQALGHRMMLAAGWGEDQWPALQALWNQESGWMPQTNPSSGAYGIPQALGHGHPYDINDIPGQIAWGLNYIRGKYGSPSGAEGHERQFNWYQRGGRVNWAGWNARGGSFVTDGPTMFGAGEGGQHERVTITPIGKGGGAHQINITMQNVTFHGGDSSQLEKVARDVAGRIMDALDRTAGGSSDSQLAGVK